MGPGSMRNSWSRHKSVIGLEDRFRRRHTASCRDNQLNKLAKQAKITTSKVNSTGQGSQKIPKED